MRILKAGSFVFDFKNSKFPDMSTAGFLFGGEQQSLEKMHYFLVGWLEWNDFGGQGGKCCFTSTATFWNDFGRKKKTSCSMTSPVWENMGKTSSKNLEERKKSRERREKKNAEMQKSNRKQLVKMELEKTIWEKSYTSFFEPSLVLGCLEKSGWMQKFGGTQEISRL